MKNCKTCQHKMVCEYVSKPYCDVLTATIDGQPCRFYNNNILKVAHIYEAKNHLFINLPDGFTEVYRINTATMLEVFNRLVELNNAGFKIVYRK